MAVSVLKLAVVWNLFRNPHPRCVMSQTREELRILVAVPVLLLTL